MSIDPREIWFPAKKYGWGWGPPLTLQGWLVLVGYFFLMAVGAITLLPAHPTFYIAVVVVLTAALIAACWAKGEKPSWRWGK